MNYQHLISFLVVLCISLMLAHAMRIDRVSNRNVAFGSNRMVRRDLRAPPIQHVYPRVGKFHQFSAQYQSMTTTTTIKPQLCNCIQIFAPVCGSNGNTFANECLLNCAGNDDKSLKIVSNGNCSTVERKNDGFNAKNSVRSHTNCACPDIYNPICGSNEQTYPNVCEFICEKRKQPTTRLRIMHRGECTPHRMPVTIPANA